MSEDWTQDQFADEMRKAFRHFEPSATGDITGPRLHDWFVGEASAAADMRSDLDARRGRTDGLYQAVQFLHGETVDPDKVVEAAEVFRRYLEGVSDE